MNHVSVNTDYMEKYVIESINGTMINIDANAKNWLIEGLRSCVESYYMSLRVL